MAADSNSFQFTYSYTLPEELSWVPGEHHSDDIVDAGVHHMARRFLTEALSSSEAIASIEDPTVEWFDPVSEWFDPVSEQPVGTHYYSRAEEDPVFSTDDHHDSLLPFAPPALPALPALNPHNLLQGHLDVDRKDVEMVMVLRDEEDSEVEEEVDGCLVEDADVESPRYDSSVEETASLSLSESVSPAVSLCTRLDCGDAAGTAATTPEVEEPLEEAPSGKLPDVVAHTSSGTTYHLRSRMKRSYVGDDDIASGDDVQPGPSSRPASLPARAGKRRRLGDDDEWAPAVEKTKTKEPKGKGKGKANGTVRKSETNGEVSQEQASPPAKNVTSEGRNAGSIYVRLRDVGRLVYPPGEPREFTIPCSKKDCKDDHHVSSSDVPTAMAVYGSHMNTDNKIKQSCILRCPNRTPETYTSLLRHFLRDHLGVLVRCSFPGCANSLSRPDKCKKHSK